MRLLREPTYPGIADDFARTLALRREVVKDRVLQALGRRPSHDSITAGGPGDAAADVSMIPAASPPSASRLSRVQSDQLLRCGCIKHPPLADFTYVGDHAEFKGLYPAMAYAVASAATLTPLIVPVDWAELNGVFEAKDSTSYFQYSRHVTVALTPILSVPFTASVCRG